MKLLFHHKDGSVPLAKAFSNGLLATCSFVNGWFCSVCGNVTEHTKIGGAQVCSVCKTRKVPPVHSAHFFDYKEFLASIHFYSDKIEFEAIEKALGPVGDESGVEDWVQVRGHLHSNKLLEEVIKNAKC